MIRIRKFFIAILLVLAISLSLGCLNQAPTESEDKIIVYATILPQKEMIEAVGGDLVDVSIIVPPGSSPHTMDLTPSQLTGLAKANMYVMIGSGIEFEVNSMDKIVDLNRNMFVVDSSKGVKLIDMATHDHHHDDHHHDDHHHDDHHHEGGKDPHIWLSPRNAKIMVQNTYEGLIEIDPENKEYYTENRDIYLKKLAEVDKYIYNELKDIPNRSFMIFHPAFGYFAKDYDLNQIAVEMEGKEPTIKSLAKTIEEAKKENIKTVFISPGFSGQAAEIITKEIGGQTDILNPLAENYIENLKITANKIKNQ